MDDPIISDSPRKSRLRNLERNVHDKSHSISAPYTVRHSVLKFPFWISLQVLLSALAFIFFSFCRIPYRWSLDDIPRYSAPGSRNPAYLIEAKYGAVATENGVCSEIGVDALKEGGNAVDAAISAALCVGVVNMFSSGIGGGGFMTVRIPPTAPNRSSEVYAIDFREVAPALANATMYQKDPMSARFGGLSVAVPGELRGFEEAHKRWGKLPWRRLVQPSVDLASGCEVGRELGERIPVFAPLMLNNPDWKAIFAPQGRFLRTGEHIEWSKYSETLAAIAEGGADAFYTGPIADAIVRKVQATGGVLSHADLANYQAKVRPALRGIYRNRAVYTTHPPTSGPVLLHMLNLVEKYDFPREGRTGLSVHRLVEAMKFGFSARTRISDPDFNNTGAYLDQIPSKEFADLIVKNITDNRTHPPDYYNPLFSVHTDHGTSHTSVIDKDGMAVALTSSVNHVFGSEVLDAETGVIFNNEMDDFSIPGVPNGFGLYPSLYNHPEPAKRPLSSITPTIMEHSDGSVYMAVGGSGGSRIFGSVFQVILNLDWGHDASQAIEYGRLHDQLYPPELDADDTLPLELLESLRQRGHNVTVYDINRVAGIVQAVLQKDGKLFAASDSRKNGIAAGY